MNHNQTKYEKRVESINTIFLKKDNFELRYGLRNDVWGQNPFSIRIRGYNEKIFCRDFELISKEFPEFKHLVRWEGFNLSNFDYNYYEDAINFAKIVSGTPEEWEVQYGKSEALKDFKILTLIDNDEELPNLCLENGEDEESFKARIKIWLDDRRKVLLEEMKKDLTNAGVIETESWNE